MVAPRTRRSPGSLFVVTVLPFTAGLLAGTAWTANARPAESEVQEVRVTGLGGIFFTAEDPEALRAWYARHLGLEIQGAAGASFQWREVDPPNGLGRTAWSVFPDDTDYFGPSGQTFMVNYRVQDLDALLARLAEEGIEPVKDVERYPYGDFAWIADGEGNWIELWESAPEPEG